MIDKNKIAQRASFSGAGLFIAIGLIVLGSYIESGMSSERVVTVKGLAEREVLADEVIWPLVYKHASNDITSIYRNTETASKKILAFLKEKGINEAEITVSPVSVIDAEAERYANPVNKFRYKSSLVIIVVSSDVELVRETMSAQSQLLKDGITLVDGDHEYRTLYSYNSLNDIKPEMIEEATKSARAAAEKFAQDSESELGKIRTANQGQFSIYDRDYNTPHIKKVRVVTTVQYLLKD